MSKNKISQNKASGFQTGNVLIVSVSHFIHDVYSSFLAPILPLLIQKFGLSYTLAGLLSIFQQIPSLINPYIGIIADKVSLRYLVILTPAITSIVMSLLGVANHYIVLAILLFVMGISNAFYHVPTPVLIKKLSGNRIGKGMSFYMIGGEVARTIGPLIIMGAISLWGLEGTYKLIPFGLLASLILFFRIRKIEISDEIKKSKPDFGILQTLINHKSFFIILALMLFSRAILKSGLTAFLPTYFVDFENESKWIGAAALSILQFAGILGAFFSGTFSDRFGRTRILLIIFIATPIFLALFLLTDGILKMLMLLPLGFFSIATGPVFLAIVQEVSSDRPAFLNSLFMTISFIASSVGVFLFSLMSDFIGLEYAYTIAAFIALGAIPLTLKLKKIIK
ncbi:MAG: MFS transporter [Saprospiraceae bacterium]|nr:MFS transporter [Saprospiraceae bacterium]